MKKLNKKQSEELKKRAQKLQAAKNKFEGATQDLNSEIEDWNAFALDIADELQSYYDERSETWQEGDVGSAFSEWVERWQEEPEEIDYDLSWIDDLEKLECMEA